MAEKALILISPWFGPWPEWINFFLISCAANAEVTWLIPTDQEPPACRPPNVEFMQMSFGAFCDRVSQAVGLQFRPGHPYKICDIKPMLGHSFEKEVADYGSWGYSDLDVVFGDIRKFYSDDLLSRYRAISAHAVGFSGHLSAFSNTRRLRLAYRRRGRYWREATTSKENKFFDEPQFENVFRPRGPLQKPFAIRPHLFVERHSTVDNLLPWINESSNHPKTWIWRNGGLTNTDDGPTEFLHLHFMNWRSDRYRPSIRGPAPWPRLSRLVQIDWQQAAEDGFIISTRGILPLAPDSNHHPAA